MSLYEKIRRLATLAEKEKDEQKKKGYLKEICLLTAQYMTS